MGKVGVTHIVDERFDQVRPPQCGMALKRAKADVAERKAREHGRARGAGFIAALQRLAGFNEAERTRCGNAERLEHRRGQHFAHAALQRQASVPRAGPGGCPRALGGEIEQSPADRLAHLGEQEPAAIAQIGIVNAELMAVIAHRQRLAEVTRQGFETREVRAPLVIGEGLQTGRRRGARVAKPDRLHGEFRRGDRIGELRPQDFEARVRSIGGRNGHARQMARRGSPGKAGFASPAATARVTARRWRGGSPSIF